MKRDRNKTAAPADAVTFKIPLGDVPSKLHSVLERLRIDPSAGQIWLDDYRMVLLHAEVFAALRRELIETVGTESARGLLTRMGYLAGSQDAALALKFGASDPTDEPYHIGPLLHALEGFVGVHTLNFTLDRAAGLCAGDFEWSGSAEADAHVATYGLSSEPACWMEVGYATGYSSTFMGRRVLVREVECRAMGNARCLSTIRPLEDWDDPSEDLKFLQAAPSRRRSAPLAPSRSARTRPGKQPAPDKEDAAASAMPDEPVGASNAFNNILHRINRVAPTPATVLMLGESGVGKSLLAREIHARSTRADEPFVEVNCAAIPDTLLEAELFGVERGAFTGAAQTRPGRFEVADGGSIFLDEISTLTPIAQGKLLRVLQTGELEHLGSTKTRRVDVRVVAATNEDLRLAMREKRFREDLFYRLNVFPIVVPPLRERRDDIPLLLEHYLRKFCARHGRDIPGVTAKALNAIQSYTWPGNIREFENVVERAIILAEQDLALDVTHLFSVSDSLTAHNFTVLHNLNAGAASDHGPHDITRMEQAGSAKEPFDLGALAEAILDQDGIFLGDVERTLLHAALQRSGGNVSKAAARLGISRATLDYRLKKAQQDIPPGEIR